MVTAPKIRAGFAEVNGVKLRYMEQGEGPLIVFLHGFPEFWYEWRNLLPEFGKDHHAVAPDMRGYNLSSQPAGLADYSVPVLVEDVGELASKLGARRFVLVGHDWGGLVAWHFAIAHPERLNALVVVNAPHPAVFARELSSNPAQQQASAYFKLFASPATEAILGANDFERLQELIRGWATDADRRQYLECWRRGLTGGLNYYRASLGSGNLRNDPAVAQPIAAPTLVLWGEKDPYLLPGNLDGLDRYVTHLTLERIPDGSHWVIHEQPQTVIRYMREFLHEVANPRP